MSVSFSQRSTAVEIMDNLEFHDEVVFQTLRELDFINHWLGGNSVIIDAIERIWKTIPKETSILIADLGCGSGEMLRLIARRAIAQNRIVKLVGIDANEHIIKYARDRSSKIENLHFQPINVLSGEFQGQSFDIILATLFLHHFTDSELIGLFQSLKKQTKIGLIVNDLHRHPIAYHSIKWLTALFSRSPMVKYDAPLSVRRAFTRNDLKLILEKAGIEKFKLRWRWAFRWQLIIFP